MSANEVVDTETGEVTEVKPEETTIAKQEIRVPIQTGEKGLELRTLDDFWRFGNYVIKSGLSPKGINNPESVVIIVQAGFELGITPMQALQNISPINGRPCPWGDLVPGLVETSSKQEYGYPTKIGKKNPDGSYPDSYGYRYTTKRKGRDEYSYEFTVADAKRAKLWGKEGPWTFYPDRMLLNRSRTFCLRDVYPDVLKGLLTVEEAKDMVDADYTVEESKSRTEKLVDLIKPQVQLKEQFPTMADLEKDASQHLEKSIEAGEPLPPEPVTPEPAKRGRPPKDKPDELTQKLGF